MNGDTRVLHGETEHGDRVEVSMPEAAPLERYKPIPAAAGAVSPMQMLSAALAQGIDPERLKQLMDLADRYEANEARKSYAADFAKFKKEKIEIRRNKTVDYPTAARDGRPAGRTTYKHATLDHVCDQVVDKLAKHGFGHSWRPRTEGGKIYVVTRITHRLGHFEEVTLEGTADTSGGKNSIQAVGSTIYYLERYGLLGILGLAPKDAAGQAVLKDDDGQGGAPIERVRPEPIRDVGTGDRLAESFERGPFEKSAFAPPTSSGHEALGTSARTEPGKVLMVGEAPLRIIRKELVNRGVLEQAVCRQFNVGKIEALPMVRVNEVLDWIKTR